MLRGADPDHLSVWVETDGPARVNVLGSSAPTFAVHGHHYALVEIDGAVPGASSYAVEIDGRTAWPPATGSVAAPVLTAGDPAGLRIMAGSCRQQAPDPLWWRRGRAGFGDLGPDALATLSHELQHGRRPAPDLLLLTGDQVYADEQHRSVRHALRRRRGGEPPDGEPGITSFDEYAWLYLQTWSHPLIRWLLSSIPSLMVFDDHDIIDDWNISDAWVRHMADTSWWSHRIRAGLASYWVYQHRGNLTPR